MPLNWSQGSSDPANTNFTVTSTKSTSNPEPALSGTQSFSVSTGTSGGSQDFARAWDNQPMPADVQVSAGVYVNSLIPAQVIARGSNLAPSGNTDNASFYAVQVSVSSPGPKLVLEKDVNGTVTTLGTVYSSTYVDGGWLEETVDVEGSTVRAQLFDPNTDKYLNSSGQMQTGQAWALTVIDNSIVGPGLVGLGRPASYTGTTTFDDFSVLTPATVQSFDATPAGSQLPDNWLQHSSGGADYVSIAAPTGTTPPSGLNALAIAPPQSGYTARAWLNSSLPTDLSVSADTYLSTVTPAQVFARGSNLNTDSPNYYAAEVSRGYLTLSLVKVVNGTQTVLGTPVTSKTYVPYVWVQETLGVSGSTLEAQVYRTDTQQYLKSDGTWQNTPTWAVTATDTSLSGPGQAGVARPVIQEPVETDYFDDFTTATGMDAQGFDSSTTLPSSVWQQWSSDAKNNYFAVSGPTTNFLSASNVLTSGEMLNTVTAAAWDTNEELTNAQVSAAINLSGTMPTVQVIARGTNLGSNTPSYYGLSFTESGDSAPSLALVRVSNGGTPASLVPGGFVQPPSGEFLNIWVQETLYVDGDNVRASIYRPDTGQYLSSDGQWQTLPTYAINAIDPDALTGPGYAGLVRPSGSAVYIGDLDNFAVTPLSVDSTPPTVTVSAPSGTQTGTVTITATPTETVPNYGIAKVEFYVDDNQNPILNWVATTSPYTWNFDTRSVSNGTHTLLVKVYDDEGNIGEATTTITTSNNTTLSMPSGFPPHQNSVGIAELDYGTGENATNASTLVQNSVDVVVGGDPTDHSNIHNWDSSVQQLIYTNVSNIASAGYSPTDALISWLNYAQTNGINAEDAFYHVAVATPYSGGSTNSTHPVDQFANVYDEATGTNDTAAAYTGGTIPFGGSANQSLDIGYLEPYWEINFDLTSAASGGWSGVLEYPTAVDGSGNPTAWGTLTTLSDTTGGFTQPGQGQVTFNPPSNWVPAAIDGSVPMYYVRIRTLTAGTAPVANTITGDNYTNSPAGSDGSSGVIPAYDWALDPQGGYLDPQEYALAAATGYTAHFGYQSRVFFDGPMRFSTNPSNPEFKAWALTYYPGLLSLPSNQYSNGLFVDNSMANPPPEGQIEAFAVAGFTTTNAAKVDLVEPTDSYSNDYATLLDEIGLAIAPNGWIMANANGALPPIGSSQPGQTNADPVISKVGSYYEEEGLAGVTGDTSDFLALYNKVYYRATNDNPGYAVIDSRSLGGATIPQRQVSEENGQTQLTTLAAYYILAPNTASQGALDFFGGEATSNNWVETWGPPASFNHWSQAAMYNVGTPVSNLPSTPEVLVANGSDPENPNYIFNVYERSFTGSNGQPVLVVYKTVSQDGDVAGHTNDPQTATTVTLPGSYYVLQPNGTLSSTAQTSISLENGEGAILVQAGGNAPAMATATAMSSIPSTSGSIASQDSAGPSNGDLLTAKSFERLLPGLFDPNGAGSAQASLGLAAEQDDASANLDQFLSQWAVEKLPGSLVGGNGPATNWPTIGSQAPLTASVPSANLWLASLRPSKAYNNNSSFDESNSPADDAVAGSSVDDPVTASSNG